MREAVESGNLSQYIRPQFESTLSEDQTPISCQLMSVNQLQPKGFMVVPQVSEFSHFLKQHQNQTTPDMPIQTSDYTIKDQKQSEAAIETNSRQSNQNSAEPPSMKPAASSVHTTIEKVKVAKKDSEAQSRGTKRDNRSSAKTPSLAKKSDSKRLGAGTPGGPLTVQKITLQDARNNRNTAQK